MNTMDQIPLGVQVAHSRTYDPGHLFAVPREPARQAMGIEGVPPFTGADIWNAYEISWLDPKGKPRVALGELVFPWDTPNIVESKSLKLYLNSLNQTRFENRGHVAQCIKTDLDRCCKGNVRVSLFPLDDLNRFSLSSPSGECIDGLDLSIDRYSVDPGLLSPGGNPGNPVAETLYSNLLRTNCPVTGQPDWATVIIAYTGPAMDRAGLLKYLVSFRDHIGFHENCTETIFTHIKTRCRPETLTVTARFTRRGGIDINPVRTDRDDSPENIRLVRQ